MGDKPRCGTYTQVIVGGAAKVTQAANYFSDPVPGCTVNVRPPGPIRPPVGRTNATPSSVDGKVVRERKVAMEKDW